jgi:hypothetical protein
LDEFGGMTVNERLFEAELLDDYNRAKATGDLGKINTVLAKVDLRQDENGMNWPLNAPNQ